MEKTKLKEVKEKVLDILRENCDTEEEIVSVSASVLCALLRAHISTNDASQQSIRDVSNVMISLHSKVSDMFN